MKIAVSSSDELTRVDLFLSQRLIKFSRTNIQKMISNQSIKVNGEWIKKNASLNYGDIIEIDLTNKKDLEETLLEKWKYPLDVLYKDKDFAIVNKPRGIIVHPAKGNYNKTLVNIVLDTFEQDFESSVDPLRPGIVHRLDKDTTGVMIIPFSEYSHWKIAEQFQNRTIQKEYIAITWGLWNKNEGVIDNFLNRNKKNPIKFEVSSTGKSAVSGFKLIKGGKYLSAVRFFPKTGRTHQIRVHCKEFGYPIFGDDLYNGGIQKSKEYSKDIQLQLNNYYSMIEGFCLHAHSIEFNHPSTNERVQFKIDPDKNFQTIYQDILDEKI